MDKPSSFYKLFTLLFIVLFTSFLPNPHRQERAIYATVWSISSPEEVDQLLDLAHQYNFNQIFFQTRYRGDALYQANRTDSTYKNTEHLCYTVKDSTFDPLAYAIKKAKPMGIEIHAWVTVFVVTPHDLWKIQPDHIYYKHTDWMTYNRAGQAMKNDVAEGAFFDVGVPAAREYFKNVVSDIVSNYAIDGVQFDYIRYPDSSYGHNPIALNEYAKVKGEVAWPKWKQQQLNQFVKELYTQIKSINPKVQVSAAVIANRDKALNKYSQDWPLWLSKKYIDKVYLMAYNTSNTSFSRLIEDVSKIKAQKKMVIVLRAWPPSGSLYPVSKINEKILITKKYHFKSVGFYSYSGMRDNHYFPYINYPW